MTSKKRPEWEVRVYGRQANPIDVDLITQIVIMLGSQLAEEALVPDVETTDEPDQAHQ